MTQLTGSPRVTRQNAIQIIAVVAVAAVGISFGRWVVPAGDSTSGFSLSANRASTASAAETIAERHFEQRGPEVLGVVAVPEYASPAVTIVERHFEQRGLEVLGAVGAVERASAAATIAERKFKSGRLDEILFGGGS